MAADIAVAQKWLAALGTYCAGNMPPDEARVRVDAYARLLVQDFDGWALTHRSLGHVARQCRFWPAYGELAERLSAWCRENRPVHDGPRLAAPAAPTPDDIAAQQEAEGRAWWQRRIAGWGPNPSVRWLNASAALAQACRPGGNPEPWRVKMLRDAILRAEADGADTSQPVPEPRFHAARMPTIAGERGGLRPLAAAGA